MGCFLFYLYPASSSPTEFRQIETLELYMKMFSC